MTTPMKNRTRRCPDRLSPYSRLSKSIILLFTLLNVIQQSSVVVNADEFTLRQVFDAIDSDHDHSISEAEYSSAVNKLLGTAGGSDTAAAGSTVGAGGKFKEKLKQFASPDDGKAFFKGLFSSFSAIIACEIGDKTFFIAAVLSMRNDRMAVFGGSILALIIMTILSTLMGLVLPSMIPKQYTHIFGGLLFLYFGFKLLNDSRGMEDKVSEELEEVEEELAEMNKKKSKARKKKHVEENVDEDDVEGQVVENGDGDVKKRHGKGGGSKTLQHAPSSGLSAAGGYSGSSWEAVFLQALTMTFLAEWGDRSQIATIALAAAKDPLGVTIGGCIGHSICTGMAVIGGRMLASRISEKSVAFYGGLVFLAFGVHSVFFEE